MSEEPAPSAGAEPPADRQFANSRLFDVPRERMFRAWRDPELLTRWWGPAGFTSTFHEFDFRPGGDWRFTFHSPQGHDFANYSVFLEIVEPERIVYDHISAPKFQVTATFTEQDAKTLLHFRMLFPTARECEAIKTYAYDANEQNFDRLQAVLDTMG